MFQSVFAYYLKNYIAIILTATIVAVLAGIRTYALRMFVSAPFGKWFQKRKSRIFVLSMTLIIGFLIAITLILIAGFGNNINKNTSDSYKLALSIIYPITFILVGVVAWCLVAGRYMQIDEVPHTRATYGTTIAFISFIAFSSDA
jgi:uncharacterized BrkB/YihY/UPF0761 family membrane protein